MTNYTDGQIVSDAEIVKAINSLNENLTDEYDHVDDAMNDANEVLSRLLYERQCLAERQPTKAGVVTDEVVSRALRASMDVQDGAVATCIGRKAMRAALASVWPTAGGDGKHREILKRQIYDNLCAADNQDIPLEDYPERIMSIIESKSVISNGFDMRPVNTEHPLFESIWQAIKGWDIERVPGTGYAGATGTDVQIIIDAIAAADGEKK